MTGRDAIELRKRFKKDSGISRIAGCYVDSNKEKVVTFEDSFFNIEEDETAKYLEIAKKALSGSIGNNILELDFEPGSKEADDMQELLMSIKEDGLKDRELLNRLYDRIIEKHAYPDNYLILLFHDRYDVLKMASDGTLLDESEEVYEYVLTAICPVGLSKPGLGFLPAENRIGAVHRERVVEAPEVAFLFPAFADRSSDIHKIDFYVKDTKDGGAQFAEEVLGCVSRLTAVQQRGEFAQIVKEAYRNDSSKYEDVLMEIQDSFNMRVEEKKTQGELEAEKPIELDDRLMKEVLDENEVDEDVAKDIVNSVKETFSSQTPTVNNLVDTRAVRAYAPKKREKELLKEVVLLKNELEQPDYDVAVRIAPDRADSIKAELVGTELCLLIPMEGTEQVSVNGIRREFE
ncbi:MAG: DUF4317 domain-containing protein [Lachnospiraceae bacterium]|nr:DUF4317 domain-containing protein [Lachnospiraceae bacterium]